MESEIDPASIYDLLNSYDGSCVIRGNSMEPAVYAGDTVYYNIVKNHKEILWGKMYLIIFDIDGEQHKNVIYIYESDKEGYCRLVSRNDNYPPLEIPINSIVELGLIKASMRILSM